MKNSLDATAVMDEAVALYKGGSYVQAFTKARMVMAEGGVPQGYSFYFMWMAYRYVRQMGANVPPDDVALSVSYFRENSSGGPSLVRSVFLAQMIELSKLKPDVVGLDAFCSYGVTILRDEDYQRREVAMPSGKKIQYESLAEKLATRLYNLLKSCRGGAHAAELMPFFRQVGERCPWNKYIKMYIGLLHFWSGNRKKIKKYVADIIVAELVYHNIGKEKEFCGIYTWCSLWDKDGAANITKEVRVTDDAANEIIDLLANDQKYYRLGNPDDLKLREVFTPELIKTEITRVGIR